MPSVEINSSFYRPHAATTYVKWADSAPGHFKFAVKMPGTITHELRLRQPARLEPLISRFVEETAGLGAKRGPVLVQLPPSLEFELRIANTFFRLLRSQLSGHVVCEPRHATWFSPKADALLIRHEIGRVAADPVRATGADRPGGWPGLVYFRLHGSPRTYWSSYEDRYLDVLADTISHVPSFAEVWVIFDNTASGAALQNALRLAALLQFDSGRVIPRQARENMMANQYQKENQNDQQNDQRGGDQGNSNQRGASQGGTKQVPGKQGDGTKGGGKSGGTGGGNNNG